MSIELTPELEEALLAESAATGLTPTEIARRAVAAHIAARAHTDASRSGVALESDPIELRRAAVERILALRARVGAEVGPPLGVGWREWIHEGHRF